MTAEEHPSAIDLEAFVCGDPLPAVAAHVADCSACRAYTARANDAVWSGREPANVGVVRLLDATRRRERARRTVAWAAVVAPFAVAAGLLVYLGQPSQPDPSKPTANGALPPTGSVAMLDPASDRGPDPETTFKGTVQLAVIRERSGAQDRFVKAVSVHPGDRLRVEVALDRPRAILGAVLGDDGSWLELMPEGVREAGTHFSETAARIDSQPTRGTILVGPPDAVRRARVTRNFDGLATVRVEWGNEP